MSEYTPRPGDLVRRTGWKPVLSVEVLAVGETTLYGRSTNSRGHKVEAVWPLKESPTYGPWVKVRYEPKVGDTVKHPKWAPGVTFRIVHLEANVAFGFWQDDATPGWFQIEPDDDWRRIDE